MSLREEAVSGVRETLFEALEWKPEQGMLVIADEESELSRLLLSVYREIVPEAKVIPFNPADGEQILAELNQATAKTLVVLIQSTNFRLNDFRIRIELFKRGLWTVEYIHLARMTEAQFPIYLEALRYDKNYYRTLGPALKTLLDRATSVRVECPGTVLSYTSPMEEAKLNSGDYREMENVGGTYPIGEVFTEPKELTALNGQVKIFGFADMNHHVHFYEPFLVTITNGILSAGEEAPADFHATLDLIRADEEVWVRELGLGLNRAMGRHALVNDVTAFERQQGLHLSLGAKHGVYAKPGFARKRTRYHIDVFVAIERIIVDETVIFEDNAFVSPASFQNT
jgi:aminopeptidase